MRNWMMAAAGAVAIAALPMSEASALTTSPFSESGDGVVLNGNPLGLGETGTASGVLFNTTGPVGDLQDSFNFTPSAPLVQVVIRTGQVPLVPPNVNNAQLINTVIPIINASSPLNVDGQFYGNNGPATTAFTFGTPFTIPVNANAVNTLNFAITLSGGLGGTGYSVEVTPVPVPAALPLMAAALAGLGLVARRRRKAAVQTPA